jgi:hypothetical protein
VKLVGALGVALAVSVVAAGSAGAVTRLMISSANIRAGAVTSPKLRFGAVTTPKIKVRSVNRARLALGAVGGAQIGTGAVGSSQLADGSIGSVDLAAGSVTSATIADGSIASVDIADSSLTGGDIADGSITPADIGSGIVRGDVSVERARLNVVRNSGYVTIFDVGQGSTIKFSCDGADGSELVAFVTPTGDGFARMTGAEWTPAGTTGGSFTATGSVSMGTAPTHVGWVYFEFGPATAPRVNVRVDYMMRKQGDADGGCTIIATSTTVA